MVIRARMPIPDGWHGARCRTLGVTAEYDPVYDRDQQDDMIQYCNEPSPCPIRDACLMYALVNNCTAGVWGGMSPKDRWALRRKYPLGLGVRNTRGTLEYHPRSEWKWLPPGEATAMLTRVEHTIYMIEEQLDAIPE